MVGGQLPLLLVGSVAVLALLLAFWQMGVSRRFGRELGLLRQQLEKVETAPAEPPVKPNFSNHLDQVERKQKEVEAPRTTSEKYRYVASLAGQGFDAKGIATALQMAPAEVEQLLKLAQLKQQTQG